MNSPGGAALGFKMQSFFNISVHHSVGETFSADTDTFQHTVTSQLMQDKVGHHETGLLVFVGDDASDKVRLSSLQVGHQSSQRFSVQRRDSLESSTLLLLTALTLVLLFSFGHFFRGHV